MADADAAEFLFRDLAAANEAAACGVEATSALGAAEVPGLPAGAAAVAARGWQGGVPKEREGGAGNRVDVHLAALRLPAHGADLLVTLSSGADIAAGSSAAAAAGAGPNAAAGGAGALLAAMLRTLAIVDYGLLGGG